MVPLGYQYNFMRPAFFPIPQFEFEYIVLTKILWHTRLGRRNGENDRHPTTHGG